jgi:predicted metal-binding membrane protein
VRATLQTSPLLLGFTLATAGFYQFTQIKRVCLTHCHVAQHWRDGEADQRKRRNFPLVIARKITCSLGKISLFRCLGIFDRNHLIYMCEN